MQPLPDHSSEGKNMPQETAASKWTTGNNYVPGSTTVQPGNSDTDHPYSHDSQDVTGFVGVDPEYRTYSDNKFKPLPVGQGIEGEEVTEEVFSPQLETEGKPQTAAQKKAAKAAAAKAS